MARRKTLEGERFGRLLVLDREDVGRWRCECDCGNSKVVWGSNLAQGYTQSCGCLQKEAASAARKTHGRSKHPIYKTWEKMKARCLNPTDRDYALYGGRGIKIYEPWLVFENFWNDMIGLWSHGLSIDRIDNNGGYQPGNVRWATQLQQASNRRNSKLVDTPWGRMTIGHAAIKMGMAYTPFAYRIKNWPQERWFDPPDAIKVRAGRPKRRVK